MPVRLGTGGAPKLDYRVNMRYQRPCFPITVAGAECRLWAGQTRRIGIFGGSAIRPWTSEQKNGSLFLSVTGRLCRDGYGTLANSALKTPERRLHVSSMATNFRLPFSSR